jgi:hypothetical protein
MGYETRHWQMYNVLRRAFGLMLLLNSAGFLANAAAALLGVGRLGALPNRGTIVLVSLATSAGTGAIGVAVCRLRTYRPDLGDAAWWSGREAQYEAARRPPEPRSWWTGEPRDG